MILMSHNIRVDEEAKDAFDKAHFDFQSVEGRKTQSDFVKHLIEVFRKVTKEVPA